MMEIEKEKKVNLGCGQNYLEGYLNVDIGDKDINGVKIKIDKKHDFNVFPYPFKDNEFNEVLMFHCLEHLNDTQKVIDELTRICKPDGKIIIKVPHISNTASFRDPTHIHYFTRDTIDYFKGFKVINKRLNYSGSGLLFFMNSIINLNSKIYERFFCWIFPCKECIWVIWKTK